MIEPAISLDQISGLLIIKHFQNFNINLPISPSGLKILQKKNLYIDKTQSYFWHRIILRSECYHSLEID